MVLTTAALVVLGWCRVRTLPLIILIGTGLWVSSMASAYMAVHGELLEGQLGAIASILGQNVGERLQGSSGHEQIVLLRLAVTAALWVLAAVGFLRLARSDRPAATGLGVVALAPFPLLVMQSYGGEALLRVGLFALPFMSFLAACALVGPHGFRRRSRPPAVALLASGLAAVLLLTTFPLTRYGNERMDWYSPDEVNAVLQLYRLSPRGSVLVAVTDALPWRSTAYADRDYRLLITPERVPFATGPVPGKTESVDVGSYDRNMVIDQVLSRMAAPSGTPAYVVLTRSQGAELELMGPWPPGALERLDETLRASGFFTPVIENGDAVVFQLTGSAS
jgi:hypothetical protein